MADKPGAGLAGAAGGLRGPGARVLGIGVESRVGLRGSGGGACGDSSLVDPQRCDAVCGKPLGQETKIAGGEAELG